ncbi:MAG: tetratricopeptide repeat protein [Luteolibacter sp.]
MLAKGISPSNSMAYRDSVGYYRPIKNLTFGLIAGMSEPERPETVQTALTTARTVGFLYCIAAAASVFVMVRHISKHEWLAVTAAGFWLLSAAGTSTATWVSAQNIALAVAFAGFSFVATSRFISRGGNIDGFLAAVTFAAGLFCYDSIVALPGMIAAAMCLLWLRERPVRQEIHRFVYILCVFAAVIGGWLYARHQAGAISDGAGNSVLFSPHTSRLQAFTASAWFFWRHVLMWIWPYGTLEIGGLYIPGKSASVASLVWGWIFLGSYLISIPVIAWRGVRRKCALSGLIALGLAMGLIGAFPSGNFIPLFAGPMGDYYTMVPSLGWCLALAAFVFLLANQVPKFRSSEARKVMPILATALLALIAANRIAGVVTMSIVAERSMRPGDVHLAAIAVRPHMAISQLNLADALIAANNPEQALPIIESALEIAPWATRMSYAQTLSRLNRFEEAIIQFDIALANEKQTERLLTANYGKAVALRKLGRKEEAKEIIQSVIHNTHYRHHLQMACFGIVVAHEAGDDETARRWLTKARELYPGRPEIAGAATLAGF